MPSFSESEHSLLTTVNLVTNLLSLLGSGFIVCSLKVLSVRSQRAHGDRGLLENVHYKLVYLVSSSDILHSISQLLGNPEDGSVSCYLQAVLSQVSLNSSFAWVLCIAITLWGTFVHGWPLGDKPFDQKLFKRYCYGVVCFMLVTTLIPFYGNHYGNSGSWCWIEGESELGEFMRFATLFVPLWVSIGVICVMYHQLIQSLDELIAGEHIDRGGCCSRLGWSLSIIFGGDSSRQDDVHFTAMLRVIRRVSLYPVVLVVCWVPATINRVQNALSEHQNFELVFAAMCMSNINGLFNAMIYGLNASLRHEIASCMCGAAEDLEPVQEDHDLDGAHAVLGDEENQLQSESIGVTEIEMQEPPAEMKRARTQGDSEVHVMQKPDPGDAYRRSNSN